MNLPNKLTVLRICLIPFFTAAFFLNVLPNHYIYAAVIFAVAAATDFVDGYIARKYNLVTNLGKFLDPIADKVLVSTALIIMLTNSAILPSVIGSLCVAVILARELIISGFRMVAASTGLVLAADKIGKLKTAFQTVAIFLLLLGAGLTSNLSSTINYVGLVLFYISVALTIISGVKYILDNLQVFKETK